MTSVTVTRVPSGEVYVFNHYAFTTVTVYFKPIHGDNVVFHKDFDGVVSDDTIIASIFDDARVPKGTRLLMNTLSEDNVTHVA